MVGVDLFKEVGRALVRVVGALENFVDLAKICKESNLWVTYFLFMVFWNEKPS